MTPREERLLVEVMELEAKNAQLIEQKWRNESDEGYVDGAEALAYERAFAAGFSIGTSAALSRVKGLFAEQATCD